jgi:hypothetical protein
MLDRISHTDRLRRLCPLADIMGEADWRRKRRPRHQPERTEVNALLKTIRKEIFTSHIGHFVSMAQQPLVGQGLLILDASRSVS